jgi:hypothetical protein
MRLVGNSQRFFDCDNPAIFTVRIDEADFFGADSSVYTEFACTDLLILLWLQPIHCLVQGRGASYHTVCERVKLIAFG